MKDFSSTSFVEEKDFIFLSVCYPFFSVKFILLKFFNSQRLI